MIEVEKRILLSDDKLDEMKKLFDSKGELIKDFKRFTILKISQPDYVPNLEDKLDIRVRTTKDKAVLTIKKGDWDDSSPREEVEIKFNVDEIKDMIRMLNMLGLNFFLMTYVHRSVYKYQEFEIVLDEYLSSDENIMEVELMAKDEKDAAEADKKVTDFVLNMGLEILDSKGLVGFLTNLNANKGFQLDLTKNTIDKWYEEYKPYILCEK